jgi:hypothetical protein
MSDAPERIWADGNAEWDSGSWGLDKEFDNDVEYVRADRIEELEAKLAKALEGLREAENAPEPDHHVPQFRYVMDIIGATLAELKGEDRG